MKRMDVTLYNGKKMPLIGYGTWLVNPEIAERCVKDALEVGYRHIDTAQGYDNEAEVGKAVLESGINRDEIFITTKVKAEIKNYAEAKLSIEESLEKLGGYIDLLLIHSPQPWDEFGKEYRYEKENAEVWRAMIEAYKAKKVGAIGVSNFSSVDIDRLMDRTGVYPMVNQIPCFIGDTPKELISYCEKKFIRVEAYCPLGHGRILEKKVIKDFATKYGTTPSELCLAYCLELGLVALPKSTSKERMADNLKIKTKISKEDMEYLKSLSEATM